MATFLGEIDIIHRDIIQGHVLDGNVPGRDLHYTQRQIQGHVLDGNVPGRD